MKQLVMLFSVGGLPGRLAMGGDVMYEHDSQTNTAHSIMSNPGTYVPVHMYVHVHVCILHAYM